MIHPRNLLVVAAFVLGGCASNPGTPPETPGAEPGPDVSAPSEGPSSPDSLEADRSATFTGQEIVVGDETISYRLADVVVTIQRVASLHTEEGMTRMTLSGGGMTAYYRDEEEVKTGSLEASDLQALIEALAEGGFFGLSSTYFDSSINKMASYPQINMSVKLGTYEKKVIAPLYEVTPLTPYVEQAEQIPPVSGWKK